MSDDVTARLLIGDSPPMQKVRELIGRLAGSCMPVLIQGPTGSGKELVARALHDTSSRTGALVAFNVCAISDTMFEDSLFGHVRGAFSGAQYDRKGYMAEAHGGTLFLDELSGLPLDSQAKLLRAVETKQYRPVGAQADKASDFRLVAATNVALHQLIKTGRFREDLAHRIKGVTIHLPPLSARGEDIPDLVRHFAESAVTSDGSATRFTPAALVYLQEHAWSGNVRELKHFVETAIALSASSRIARADLEGVDTFSRPAPVGPDSEASVDLRRLKDTLLATQGDVAGAATMLGVHKVTVYRWMKRWGIGRPLHTPLDGNFESREEETCA